MVTMKDIARLAGVSSATVSNVLNGKGNVSLEKVRLVLEAAEKTGYSINYPAKQLRQNASASSGYSVAVILPNVTETQYALFYEAVKGHFERQGKRVFLFTTRDAAHEEKMVLDTIAAMRMSGVVTVSCASDAASFYAPLRNAGIKIVYLQRAAGGAGDFFTFDYRLAGREAAQKALGMGVGRMGVLCNSGAFSPDADFLRGVGEALDAWEVQTGARPALAVQQSAVHAACKNAVSFFASPPVPDVILCASPEYGAQVQLAHAISGGGDCPPLIALSHRAVLADADGALEYRLDCQKLATQAAERLQQRIEGEGSGPATRILPAAGFKQAVYLPRHVRAASLRVLLINGPSADALMTLSGRFSGETGIDVRYTVMTPEEIVPRYLAMDRDREFDVVRANVSVLPLLPLQVFVPYEEAFFREVTDGMFPRIVNTHSLIGGIPYAIPFDIGGQVLVYRNDIFADPMVRRMYFEQCDKNLEVPADYDEMNQVARFFNRDLNPHSPVRYGASTGMGNDAEIFISFMTRYRHFSGDGGDDVSFDRFDQFAALAAIENYVEFCGVCHIMQDSARIETGHEIFVQGECAMEAISFNYGSDLTKLYSFGANRQIGYYFLPGGKPMLGGGSMLITRHCEDYDAAASFVGWACGSRQAESLTYLGGVSPHKSVYENIDILNLYPWYRLVEATMERISSRHLWDTYNVYSLETLVAGTVKRVLAGRISPREAAAHIGSNIYTCLIPRPSGRRIH